MVKERMSSPAVKSTLKWVGGKRRIAKEITSSFPVEFGTYFEPFVGGASVFLEVKPKTAALSDLNSSLINYYEMLKKQPEELKVACKKLEKKYNGLESMELKAAMFYKLRSNFNASKETHGIESASKFLFLNKTAFNGLYRENSKGDFNVPFNNKQKLVILEEQNFLQNSQALANVKLSVCDFTSAVQKARKGDLVYFDPPYIPLSSTAAFTAYTKSSFGPEAQIRLRDLALELMSNGVNVVLSNSFSAEVANLYKGFELREIKIQRLVAASSTSRGSIGEYLIVGRPGG